MLRPSQGTADLVGLTHDSREWRFTEVVIAEGVMPLKHFKSRTVPVDVEKKSGFLLRKCLHTLFVTTELLITTGNESSLPSEASNKC